jgi:hypothetical protein
MSVNSIVGVRLSSEDRKLLDKVTQARGEDKSDFIRRSIKKELAVLGFLSLDDRKALGMEKITSQVIDEKIKDSVHSGQAEHAILTNQPMKVACVDV